ncbi:MAG: diaminopimelate epimerase [Candidatus Omnitrophota bacterium]
MDKKYNICFTKAVASGNDFIIVDNINGELDSREFDYPSMARDLCSRRFFVGADGLLILENSDEADFYMRVINPDGSEVTMCGNGARCSALYGSTRGMGEKMAIETGAGIINAEVNESNVRLKMGDPRDIKLGIKLGIGQTIMDVHFVDTGVPHVVHLVDEIEDYPVKEVGRKIREHSLFAPEGTNADFVGNVTEEMVYARTYERGVEDETLACGTGITAAAIILGLLGQASSPVKIRTQSGEVLTVYYEMSGKKISDVYLEGAADIVYEGRV